MREIYIILGWIGWIWFAIATSVVGLVLGIQYLLRRKEQVRGFQVIHQDEKQS